MGFSNFQLGWFHLASSMSVSGWVWILPSQNPEVPHPEPFWRMICSDHQAGYNFFIARLSTSPPVRSPAIWLCLQGLTAGSHAPVIEIPSGRDYICPSWPCILLLRPLPVSLTNTTVPILDFFLTLSNSRHTMQPVEWVKSTPAWLSGYIHDEQARDVSFRICLEGKNHWWLA